MIVRHNAGVSHKKTQQQKRLLSSRSHDLYNQNMAVCVIASELLLLYNQIFFDGSSVFWKDTVVFMSKANVQNVIGFVQTISSEQFNHL